MRTAHYLLTGGILLSILGFATAALLDKRQLGMVIFLVGFFIGSASAVSIVLTSASSGFGKLGTAIKIAAGGFGIIIFGELLSIMLGGNGLIGEVFFFVGIAVMLIATVVAALRLAKL